MQQLIAAGSTVWAMDQVYLVHLWKSIAARRQAVVRPGLSVKGKLQPEI